MREAIWKYAAPAPVPVATPEWPEQNGQVFVRTISAKENDAYEDAVSRNMDNARARLVVMAACDESGQRIFEDNDVERVGNMPASVVARIWGVARKLAIGDGLDVAVKN